MYKAPSNILFKKEKRLDEDIIRTKDLIYRIVRVGLGVICILRSRKANDKNFKGQTNVGQQPPSQPPIEESFQKTKRMVGFEFALPKSIFRLSNQVYINFYDI